MKSRSVWILCCAGLCLWTAAALSQSSSPATGGTSTENQTALQPAGRAQHFYHSEMLMGKEAKDIQGRGIGRIQNIAFDPQTGETFVAIKMSTGRYALVPWQALKVTTTRRGKEEVTLLSSKQTVEAFPTVTSEQWQKLDDPEFTQSIYSHYNLQRPSALGGAGPAAMGGGGAGAGTGTAKPISSGQP